MNRTAWLAAIVLVLAPTSGFAQMGGMGGGMGGMGMGGMGMGGMGGGFGSVETRRAVQVEMEGGRRINGQVHLGTLTVISDLGHHAIRPDRIKMIRFLKPANEPRAADDDVPQPAPAPPPGGGNNAMMMRGMMRGGMMGGANQNNAMGGPTVRAKVILNSGEEIIGDIGFPSGTGFRLTVDYGTMIPALDKLRTMTFVEADKKTGPDGPGPARPGEGSPRAARDDDDHPSGPPDYLRHNQSLVVRSHAGDRVMLYNMDNKQTLELSGPKDAPMGVTPIYAPDLMALSLQGPKISRIAVADNATGWHVQELRRPAEGGVMPLVSQGVAVYTVGRYAYAYSVAAHRWDVAELPQDLPATPIIGPNTATIEGVGHVYTFAGKTGKWEHVDVRAILDVAESREKK